MEETAAGRWAATSQGRLFLNDLQAIFLPAMALAFAVAPVAGQNFGAQLHDRLRETFRSAVVMSVNGRTMLSTDITTRCTYVIRSRGSGWRD